MIWFIYFPIIAGFIFGIIKYWISPIVERVQANKTDTVIYYDYEDEKPDINDLERLERYGQQIDGYTQAIKLLDAVYKEETDTKKKAAILSKQLTLMDKLDRTITKLEKLDI